MDAVLLSLCSAACYGAVAVALRSAVARDAAGGDLATLLTVLPAFAMVLAAAIFRFDFDMKGLWPFVVAGVLSPGISQTLFTLGVRDAGAARAAVSVGTAPLFSVAIALVALGEPIVAGVLAGAALIVGGGVLLVGEGGRPAHVKRIGLVFAVSSAVVFATRDNLVRWLAIDSDVSPELAAAVTLGVGTLAIGTWLVVARRPISLRPLPHFAPAGLLFGLSYICIFEAFYRGPVTVVSPLVATESLWAVLLSALFLRRIEVVGARLVVGATLVVAGGVLIGVFR
jgi:drug/metabolite transporter (DMT)-like permease